MNDEVRAAIYHDFVNRTARSAGAVGGNALVPKVAKVFLDNNYALTHKVLDFGAGPKALQAEWLRSFGYRVDAYEVGDNHFDDVHVFMLEEDEYTLVYASNVLNVQPSLEALDSTIYSIAMCAPVAILNYPNDPRHCPVEVNFVVDILMHYYRHVERVYGEPGRPIWLCIR